MSKLSDMTPLVDLTRTKGAGPVRSRRPIYVDLLPPCNHACPAGENIQAWLDLVQAGKYREAWEVLVRDNPMPAVHGRACYHPCEDSCNRRELDASVSIHAVERLRPKKAGLSGSSALRRANESWSLVPARAASQPPIISHVSGTRWRFMRQDRFPEA